MTKLGIQQANKVADEIANQGLSIDLVITSPLIRALDTAKIICKKINYPQEKIIIDSNTVERNFGTLEGNKNLISALKYALNESNIDHVEGVEKLIDLQKRADKFYEHLKTLAEENIIIVGHGAFARALSRSINNVPISDRHIVLKNGELAKFI